MFRNHARRIVKISQNYRRSYIKKLHDVSKSSQEYKITKFEQTESLTSNSEIKHLEKFGSMWWDPKGSMRPLHSMNMIRVPFIRDGLIATNKVNPDFIKTDCVLDSLNILEVGCGGGILTEQLGRLRANVIGIDLSDKLIEIARDHLTNESQDLLNRVQYKFESIEEHSRDNKNKYDAVIVSEVVEHVDEQVKFLSYCVDTLKSGGSIFITTFNKTFLSLLGGVIAAEYILRIIPKGTHDWNKFISPIEAQRILENSNCSIIFINGFFYQFWRDVWNWMPSIAFSYAMQAIKST